MTWQDLEQREKEEALSGAATAAAGTTTIDDLADVKGKREDKDLVCTCFHWNFLASTAHFCIFDGLQVNINPEKIWLLVAGTLSSNSVNNRRRLLLVLAVLQLWSVLADRFLNCTVCPEYVWL